jgi:hypothetical protein
MSDHEHTWIAMNSQYYCVICGVDAIECQQRVTPQPGYSECSNCDHEIPDGKCKMTLASANILCDGKAYCKHWKHKFIATNSAKRT